MSTAVPMTAVAETIPEAERRRMQAGWGWYDWANSAFFTTVLTVMFAPYMITVAGRAAGCVDADENCARTLDVLGIPIAAGSLPSYLTSFATITSALILPIVGAYVDRSPNKVRHMTWYAWAGAAVAAQLFWLRDEQWQIAAVAVVVSSILAGCSLVSYSAILVDISTDAERDRVSARGWAWGYLGGGLLLAVNLGMFLGHDAIGLSESMAVRLSLVSAAIWWAGFTLIPAYRLRGLAGYARPALAPTAPTGQTGRAHWSDGFRQLGRTLRELPRYPVTLTFLLAYLFYNDGIQTVIYAASTYGQKELGLGTSTLIATILLIQFVAFGGALLFGRLAQRWGSYRIILIGILIWMAIVIGALFLPRKEIVPFLVAAVAIGLVLGGTQALSRSFFSMLIPTGREGEYFSLYHACERGTSWFGTLLFGVLFQVTGSYRPALFALIIFFVLGALLLVRVDPRRGVAEARGIPLEQVPAM